MCIIENKSRDESFPELYLGKCVLRPFQNFNELSWGLKILAERARFEVSCARISIIIFASASPSRRARWMIAYAAALLRCYIDRQ